MMASTSSGGGGGSINPEDKSAQDQQPPISIDELRSIRLTLVRHGQTFLNRIRVIQGQLESDLTDLGKEQAMLLGRYFSRKKVKFDKVYSSDMTRSLETCKIICQHCRQPTDPEYQIHQTATLRERSYGKFQGLTGAEMRQKAAEAGQDPSDKANFKPEGGENIHDVAERVKDFCRSELFPNSKHLQRILVVCHGGVIREFMRMFVEHGCPLTPEDLVVTPNSALNNFDVHLRPDDSMVDIYPRRIHKLPHLTFNVFDRSSPSGEDSGDDEEIDLSRVNQILPKTA